MSGAAEVTGPQYISSHSADVILSDIRPIKLKLEALRSINVLLDEFLFNILNTARSLSTDKLRASLLSILPTSLGKEALLEAEVELRAYWDRTPRPATNDDDSESFNLQWAFELLRLKCEAYCTLNESDEDSAAITRLQEKMAQLGSTTPPLPSLIPPASLYLTAILESMCEHILSNVGRVAARDSSRTSATVQDVFVALCEDHSIYALFKSMRVYQQIETLTQTPKPRRSKSFSRGDRPSLSRNSPSNQDLSSGRESATGHRSRGSADITPTASTTVTTTASISTSTSRSSFDKARKKLMSGGRGSNEESRNGHKRSESVLSDDTKQTLAAYNLNDDGSEDSALEKEFDNLMRSGSTMKVSLTPDRLKTMEVHKQEKDQRGNRRPAPLAIGKTGPGESSSTPPSRANGRRPSLRPVDSINEDEEELPSKSAPTQKRKNSSIKSPPNNLPSTSTTSISSTSNSSGSRVVPRKSSRSNLPSNEASPPLPMPPPKRGAGGPPGGGAPRGFDADPGFPVKTRRIQKNRESLDLDDVMGGSDDEDESAALAPAHAPRTPAKEPMTPNSKMRSPQPSGAVSKSTRELMDFLNEGPPDVPKISSAGRDMVDFLNQGPPDFGGVTSSNGVSSTEGKKGSGRLQRMMSKLSMGGSGGGSERSRSQPSEDFGRRGMPPPTTPVRTTPGVGLAHQTSYTNMSALANRPVPPRPPPVQPISPPSSPSDEDYGPTSRSRKASAPQPASPRRAMPTWEQQLTDGQAVAKADQHPIENGNGPANGNGHSRAANGHAIRNGNGNANGAVDEQPSPRSRRPSAAASESAKRAPKPVAIVQTAVPAAPRQQPPSATVAASPALPAPPPAPLVAEDQARDMRRLFARATSADECRLIFEMFLAKTGVPLEPVAATSYEVPYPSPSLSDSHAQRERDQGVDGLLELALVEMFLGGGEVAALEQAVQAQAVHVPPPRKPRSKKRSEAAAPSPTVAAAPVADMPAPVSAEPPRKYANGAGTQAIRTYTQSAVPVPEIGA